MISLLGLNKYCESFYNYRETFTEYTLEDSSIFLFNFMITTIFNLFQFYLY